MNQHKYDIGDIVYIKPYDDIKDHVGIGKSSWESMIDIPLTIINKYNYNQTVSYAIRYFRKDYNRYDFWYLPEDSLFIQDDNVPFPDMSDYI